MLEKFKQSTIWGSIGDGEDTTLKTSGEFNNHQSMKLKYNLLFDKTTFSESRTLLKDLNCPKS